MTDIERSWNAVAADRLRRHLGQKLVRKRSWKEAVEAAAPQPELAVAKAAPQLSNGLLHPPVRPASSGIFNAASAQLELAEKSRDSCNEASKLTSEVAFWLRHLTIPMARTLTSTNGVVQKQSPPEKQLSNGADDANSSPTPDEGSSDGSDNETLPRWPGIDSVMVLYMAHQQGNYLISLYKSHNITVLPSVCRDVVVVFNIHQESSAILECPLKYASSKRFQGLVENSF